MGQCLTLCACKYVSCVFESARPDNVSVLFNTFKDLCIPYLSDCLVTSSWRHLACCKVIVSPVWKRVNIVSFDAAFISSPAYTYFKDRNSCEYNPKYSDVIIMIWYKVRFTNTIQRCIFLRCGDITTPYQVEQPCSCADFKIDVSIRKLKVRLYSWDRLGREIALHNALSVLLLSMSHLNGFSTSPRRTR